MALGERASEDFPPAENPSSEKEKDSFDEIDFRYFFDEYLDTGYKNRNVEESEKPSFETFGPVPQAHVSGQAERAD